MNRELRVFQFAFSILVFICASCDNIKHAASDNSNTITADTSAILKQEQKLIEAYKSNDLKTVAHLYHDNLIFNTPDGRTITGAEDIESLRSGILKIEEYNPSNYSINVTDDVATVSVSLHLKGKVAGNFFEGNFKFLRVWKQVDNDWKLIAISGTQVK